MADFQKDGDIYLALNPDYVSGDNAKYMTMYNRLARWYDFGEKWIGPLLHGKAIDKLRKDQMAEIEWKDHLSVLYVSIGTGQDLRYIPKNIDLKSLDFVGGGYFHRHAEKMPEILRQEDQSAALSCLCRGPALCG